MKITKNQLYVVMIAAAALAWGVDRFVLGGGVTAPASANAAPLSAAVPTAAAAAPIAIAPAAPHTLMPLARRFAAVTATGARDAFAPPPQWIPAREDAPPVSGAAPEARPAAIIFDAAAFRKQHKLTAVLLMGRNAGAAIIDGKMVDVGGLFMGLRLRELSPTSATLTGSAGDVVLQTDTPSPRDAAAPANSLKSTP